MSSCVDGMSALRSGVEVVTALYVVALVGVKISDSSSSSSDTVYECFNFEGEVIGEAAVRLVLGGVLGLFDVGEAGEAGLRNGEERGTAVEGDLKDDYT